MRKVVSVLCVLFAVSRPLFAAPAAETTPAMDLLKAWSPVEAALAAGDPWERTPGERAPLGQELRSAAAAFRQSLEGFIATPLYAEFAGKGLIENRGPLFRR